MCKVTGGGTYKQIKQLLEAGRTVLFTGTPCQISALYSVLGGSGGDKLITAEVVCHGVSSFKIFHEYLSHLEKKHKGPISDYRFRSKAHGWGINDFFYDQRYVTNNKTYTLTYLSSFFMVNYRRNNLTRVSCFYCPYAEKERRADFTMGDFHGFNKANLKTNEKINPYYGLSVFLANTKKAEEYLPLLSKRLVLEEVRDISQALKSNCNLCSPPVKGERWQEFMDACLEGRLVEVIENGWKPDLKLKGTLLHKIPLPVLIFLKKTVAAVKRAKN